MTFKNDDPVMERLLRRCGHADIFNYKDQGRRCDECLAEDAEEAKAAKAQEELWG